MRLSAVKETSVYVDDLPVARDFYREVLNLEILLDDPRLCAFSVAGGHVLLVFLQGASNRPLPLPGGTVPPHDGQGPVHVGFAVGADEIEPWTGRLRRHGIEIVSRVTWPLGGTSIYFHDPAGNLLELLTPGVWTIY